MPTELSIKYMSTNGPTEDEEPDMTLFAIGDGMAFPHHDGEENVTLWPVIQLDYRKKENGETTVTAHEGLLHKADPRATDVAGYYSHTAPYKRTMIYELLNPYDGRDVVDSLSTHLSDWTKNVRAISGGGPHHPPDSTITNFVAIEDWNDKKRGGAIFSPAQFENPTMLISNGSNAPVDGVPMLSGISFNLTGPSNPRWVLRNLSRPFSDDQEAPPPEGLEASYGSKQSFGFEAIQKLNGLPFAPGSLDNAMKGLYSATNTVPSSAAGTE